MQTSKKEELALEKEYYRKSNELINAKGKGTLLCQKLFAVGMQNIHVDETNNAVAVIYSSELKRLFNTDSGSLYTHIEKLIDKSMVDPTKKESTIFDWQLVLKDKDEKRLSAHQVVTDAIFEKGVLTIRYNNSLTDRIVNLSNNYTVLSLAQTMNMKSLHSLRMMELLKAAYDYEVSITKQKGVHAFTFAVMELKMALGIVPSNDKKIRELLNQAHPDYDLIEEVINEKGLNSYNEFKAFNSKVLKKAIQEINEKTDLNVTYKQIKAGNKTVAIRFFVEKGAIIEENAVELSQEEKDDLLDELYLKMRETFKLRELMDILEYAEYDKKKILTAYDYMLSMNTAKKPVAYMKNIIKNGYKKKEIKPKGNAKVHNFEERTYTDEEWNDLEIRLLKK